MQEIPLLLASGGVSTAVRGVAVLRGVATEVAERIVLGDPGMIELLKELQIKKRDKTIKSLSNTDSDSVFEILERESPFSKS